MPLENRRKMRGRREAAAMRHLGNVEPPGGQQFGGPFEAHFADEFARRRARQGFQFAVQVHAAHADLAANDFAVQLRVVEVFQNDFSQVFQKNGLAFGQGGCGFLPGWLGGRGGGGSPTLPQLCAAFEQFSPALDISSTPFSLTKEVLPASVTRNFHVCALPLAPP